MKTKEIQRRINLENIDCSTSATSGRVQYTLTTGINRARLFRGSHRTYNMCFPFRCFLGDPRELILREGATHMGL